MKMCSEVYNKERSNLGFRALFAVCHATFTPSLKGGWPPSLITAGCAELPVWARSSSAPRAPCESSRRRLTGLPLGQDSHFASPAVSMFLVTTSYQCKHLKDLYYRCAAWAEMQQQYRLFWHNFPPRPVSFLLGGREEWSGLYLCQFGFCQPWDHQRLSSLAIFSWLLFGFSGYWYFYLSGPN